MRVLKSKKKLVVAAAAVAVLGAGGAAIASSSEGGPSPSSFLDSVAKHLGISRDSLDDATRAAAIDQVDAAVEAGQITKEQADRLKERIKSGEVPPFFGGPFLGPRFGPHFFGPPRDGEPGFGFHFEFEFGLGGPHDPGASFSAAAKFLGLTVRELRERLADGDSLADVAKAEGKSVEGLVDLFLADAKERLDKAVEAGRITETRAKEILERLEAGVREFVEGGFRGFHRFRHGPGELAPEPNSSSLSLL
jgi:hypothetical protein